MDVGAGAVAGARAIAGVVGQITWAYYRAAALEGYTVTRRGASWQLRARVVVADAFMLTQRPLVFVAPHQGGAWRWPIDSMTVQDGQLSATLGPPLP